MEAAQLAGEKIEKAVNSVCLTAVKEKEPPIRKSEAPEAAYKFGCGGWRIQGLATEPGFARRSRVCAATAIGAAKITMRITGRSQTKISAITIAPISSSISPSEIPSVASISPTGRVSKEVKLKAQTSAPVWWVFVPRT